MSEVAKQRELGGTLQSQSDAKLNKQFSDSKFKELSGHNIFAPPPEIKLRPTVRALAYKDNFDLGESDTKPVMLSLTLHFDLLSSLPIGFELTVSIQICRTGN